VCAQNDSVPQINLKLSFYNWHFSHTVRAVKPVTWLHILSARPCMDIFIEE